MAYFGSKGYFVAELKKMGITKIDGYNLKSYKTHVLRKALEEAQSKQA